MLCLIIFETKSITEGKCGLLICFLYCSNVTRFKFFILRQFGCLLCYGEQVPNIDGKVPYLLSSLLDLKI